MGSLKLQRLERLTIRSGKATASEQVLARLGQRVRDVRQGPVGWLYLLADARARDGQLLRITATP